MSVAKVNGIEICFESMGDRRDPTLLLVMGFTAQLTAWTDEFCKLFVDAGFHIVRFDNRDCGLSTHFDGVKVDLPAVLRAWETDGPMPPVPYGMADFSNDAIGVLNHLGIERAHIVGASMGGMIVQQMAIDHPTRVSSMTSIMSTSGERAFYLWDPATRAAMSTPAPTGRAEYIAYSVGLGRLLCGIYFDEARSAARAAGAYDRAFYPEGAIRQTAAIRASGSRADGLRTVDTPTLVVHGREDTLIKVIGGERTAELVPGADLLILAGMGHDIPPALAPRIASAVVANCRRA
jgi:pimeloyl-ACP methyl ester carboxylesterase